LGGAPRRWPVGVPLFRVSGGGGGGGGGGYIPIAMRHGSNM